MHLSAAQDPPLNKAADCDRRSNPSLYGTVILCTTHSPGLS
jgi:hypothetical protein